MVPNHQPFKHRADKDHYKAGAQLSTAGKHSETKCSGLQALGGGGPEVGNMQIKIAPLKSSDENWKPKTTD